MTRDFTILVRNLCSIATPTDLVELFSNFGEVVGTRLDCDPVLLRPNGSAFVRMKTPQQALACIRELNGTVMNGRALSLDWSNTHTI